MKKAKKRIEIDKLSMLVTAEADVTLDELESYVQAFGFTAGFRDEPRCTLREWFQEGIDVACRADGKSGLQRVYGVEVLLEDGTALQLGTAPRSSAGPDLKGLFWGSYGIFGTLSYITLRLNRKLLHPTVWELASIPLDRAAEIVERISELFNFRGDWMVRIEPAGRRASFSIEFDPALHPKIWELLKGSPQLEERFNFSLWELSLDIPWLYAVISWDRLEEAVEMAEALFGKYLNGLYLTNGEHWGGGLFISLSSDILDGGEAIVRKFAGELSRPFRLRGFRELFYPLIRGEDNFLFLERGKKIFYEKISYPEKNEKNR